MFGISKEQLIKNLEIVRENLCCYFQPTNCDCKFGPVLKTDCYPTEHTGCPEIRQVILILKNMSEQEFDELVIKSNIIITG